MAKIFGKLKKQIENLFAPELKMQFCCIAYRITPQWGEKHIPRFYVKLGKEIIWDYPKDYKGVNETDFHIWACNNNICDTVRFYIDAPIDGLLERKFQDEDLSDLHKPYYSNYDDVLKAHSELTDLFKATDRRLGKEKLIEWAEKKKNRVINKIMHQRFGVSPVQLMMANLSFQELAKMQAEQLAKQRVFTLEEMREQARRVKENSLNNRRKKHN